MDAYVEKRIKLAADFREHMNIAAAAFLVEIAQRGEAVHAPDIIAGLSGSTADVIMNLTPPGEYREKSATHFLATVARIVGSNLDAPAHPSVDHITPPLGPTN